VNEGRAAKGLITISQGISKGLEAMAVSYGREIALLEAMELDLELNNTALFVVVEEVADLLRRVCRRLVLHDHIHHVISKGGMDPHEDSQVSLDPSDIIGARRIFIDVRKKVKPTKNDAKSGSPTPERGGEHIKSDRNKALDVDILVVEGKGRRSCGGAGDFGHQRGCGVGGQRGGAHDGA
jgi:hypothetical protein